MNKTPEEIENDNEKSVKEYTQRFLTQSAFPPFRGVSDPKKDYRSTFQHTAYLIFIRSKYLFLGIISELEKNNMFSSYALLKAYWETVASMGYFILRIEKYIQDGGYEDIVALSMKIAMGGKKYPTEEMIKNKGENVDSYLQPNLLTMMGKIDKDLAKMHGSTGAPLKESIFSEEYNVFIAEAGHTTFLGLFPGARRLADGSLLPDIKRSGDEEDRKTILNYLSLSSIVFFYYWGKCSELK